MADTYIIDGYNLMRPLLDAGRGKGAWRPGDLEPLRALLESRLRSFRRACGPGTRIHLVYDGEPGIAAPARREKGFEVHFSKPPRQADDVIIDLCRKLEGQGRVHLVTSDLKDIAGPMRGLRVHSIPSLEFALMVEKRIAPRAGGKREAGPEAAGEKPGSVSASEVDEWARAFGFGEPGGEA